ncbi:MAG: putative membrane protein YfcA [Saprospiraceae bacterium]|jgi:uncharacterized membrane protein YfcA
MAIELYTLIPVFFIIALFYSAAGFGGGSSYLAVLALFSFEFTTIRLLALMCNITVVSGSIYIFYQNGYLKLKKIFPLIILSIPFAYMGGRMKISQDFFFILLGFTLLTAAILMLLSKPTQTRKLPVYANAFIGSGIGFLSGIVGIGGGVFLSPLLYLSRWGAAKNIAACTALFILVNSIAGLTGQVMTNGFPVDFSYAAWLIGAVFLGGQIGARLTAFRLDPIVVKRITAILILLVAVRVLWRYLV